MKPLHNWLVLLLLWVVFYASFTLFVPPLLDDADSVHAEVAREMLVRHDWVTLYANGIRYLEKAPILYWSMAASFGLLGVSTAAARLPIALTVLGLALALEGFARRACGSARAGLYAGLILLSSFGIFIFSRLLLPDVDVCLWLTLAMLCFWATEQQETPNSWACWGFAACCAINVLTKGLIGIVFPVLIVLVYLLLTRNVPRGTLRGTLSRLGQLHPWSSLLVFLLLAAPWHVLIALANPMQGHPGGLSFVQGHWSVPLPTDGNVHGWLWFYFVNEQVLRYLNLRVPSGLRHGAACFVRGIDAGVADAMERRICRHGGAGGPLAAGGCGAGGRGCCGLMWAAVPLLFFSLFDAAGVLRAAGAAASDHAIDRGVAERGVSSGQSAPDVESQLGCWC